MKTILIFSAPEFRNGYDVKLAVIADSAASDELLRRLAPAHLTDNLLRDSIAGMRKQWPLLFEQLRAGAVIGMHGSARRFGLGVRYAVWGTALVDVSREDWLAAAEVIIEAVHDRDRLDAYRRIGKQYAYQAFQVSPQPQQLAVSLSRELTARLRRASEPGLEHEAILDDLTTLGHPFWLWDDGGDGEAWEGDYAYAPPEAGAPSRRISLGMRIGYGPRKSTSEVTVEIWVSTADGPPGFPAE